VCGSGDLGASKLFSGHFINFGYWTDDVAPAISRATSELRPQANLYREVLRCVRADIGEGRGDRGCREPLRVSGFEPIGAHVRHGFDAWMQQTRVRGSLVP